MNGKSSELASSGRSGSLVPSPPEELLLRGVMLCCPWCGHWAHVETYITLQIPPNYPRQSATIYKCRETGCKMLFALSTS